ncbi:SWI/SNF-related matrix-associated actin-dependent regulator of chromatin subfamily A containing DEAD/H box 1A [Kryptolebias marmoratus]|uniref:SWI/SNF-related matrix-associated actin-dependent regulator of chromatin subfamily A containing DEAD/H box 1A n=1 Tax=Kryptolebias marmoratus TaxID=37003 RepID=UPI0007F91C2D|nr:SWI/SNF-related matrix-associated actin-dependent regulator of chromatin subfamily A containing DEAD/H box 1A [Kryptolebias marmoratus]
MSLFNLDRFRFMKKGANKEEQVCGTKSPDSEKENRPARMKPVKTPSKSHARGVVFEEVVTIDLEEDEVISEPKKKTTPTQKFKSPVWKAASDYTDDEDNDMDEKMNKLLEMFPQLTRTDVLEIIRDTSTLEGAVAACLLKFGDKEAQSQGRKRKQDESSSSQDSGEIQPSKKRRPSVASDEEENDEKEPNWEKQEAMVRRLQRRFPDQDKEELRMVLQEHYWNVKDALQVLQLFSDTENSSSSSADSQEQKSKSKDKSSRDHADSRNHKYEDGEKTVDCKDDEDHRNHSESDGSDANDTDVTKDSEDDSESEDSKSSKIKSDFSVRSSWIAKKADSVPSSSSVRPTSTSSFVTPSSSSSTSQTVSRYASETSIAMKQAAERKKAARASRKTDSSDGESDYDEDSVTSEFEESDDELDAEGGKPNVRKEIVAFFQNATIDELSLIAGCSVKKAQRIVELRPFDTWESLWDVFHKGNGLSEDLLQGCKVVLKERKVVLGLMSKCETISSKMVKRVTKVMDNGMGSSKQPSILNSQFELKPYQLIGLKWLLLLHEHNLSGILADEMGLGKTIQAIAFLAQLYENEIQGPHLIIVPSSTLDNWVRELKLWCPSLKVLIYYGSVEERRYLKHDILNQEVEFNVIVTTYNSAIGNENDRSLFRKLHLKYAVFDEGHMLKNMNSLRYRHLMSINADHRLLLTGTPLQNNLLELMSLLNFIMPSMFSSSTMQLSKMFSMKSYEEQSRFERDRISQAKLIMKPFILRRVKSEVLKQLPAKEEKIEFCSMSEKQKALYKALIKKLKTSTNGEKRELCNVMMQLRKMANHPLLHRQYYTTEKLKAMSKLMLKEPTHFDASAALIQEDMEVMSDFELHRLCRQYSSISSYQLDNSLLLDSGKFHHLKELLASLKSQGDRVVLFSQFTMMLDIVEVLLKHLHHRYVRLDGSTPIADRIVLIDEYNTDPEIFVFLLSTRAGGLGINLTSANVVILHDIDCNPYNDKQAEDRCHRVGQTRTVQVIKLISKDSIEDCILQLGHKKLKLEQDMTAAEQGVEGTIPEDMASLLKASLGL